MLSYLILLIFLMLNVEKAWNAGQLGTIFKKGKFILVIPITVVILY